MLRPPVILRLQALTTAVALVALASPARGETVRVGVVQVDGLLVPLFQHHEGAWSAPWPPGDGSHDAVIDVLSDVPRAWLRAAEDPAAPWFAWLFDGTVRDLRPLRPNRSDACGEGTLGLQTDLPARSAGCPYAPEAGFCCPFEKAGLAFDSPTEASLFTAIETDAPRHAGLLSLVWPEFNSLEAGVMRERLGVAPSDRGSGFARYVAGSPIPPPMELQAFVAYETDGSALYHLTATRSYERAPDSHDPHCPDMTVFSGWVQESASGSLELLQGAVVPTTCDMKVVETLLPFGRFRLASGSYILGQVLGYESEEYVILEDRGDRIVPVSERFLYYGL